MAENENLPPRVIKEIAKELKSLDESPPGGIKVVVNDDNFSTIFADIEGPAGTPYESGVFQMKLVLTPDFPNSPPKGYFVTKIFHPNIANNGEICVNTLKKDWNPTLGLRHVLLGWGVAVLTGVPRSDAVFKTNPVNFLSEKTLKGTFFGNYKPRTDFPGLVEMYLNGELGLDKFVTDKVSFADINKAFDHMLKGEGLRTVIKVIQD